MNPPISRRNFIAGCATCAASASCPALASTQASPIVPLATSNEKTKLRLVFTHIPPEKATWPYQGYDYESRKQGLASRLRSACPNVEFLPVTAVNAEEGKRILEMDSEVDGYLVYMVGIWSRAPQVIAESGRPALLVDDLYAGSGEFLIQYAAAKRKGLKVAGISSTRFEDVVDGIKALECMKKLRSSVILDVTERDPGSNGRAVEDLFGTKVRKVSAAEINEAYDKADMTEAQKMAARWIHEAKKTVEPSKEEIQKSGAMYLAMRSLMQEHGSPALTIDCLNLFYNGHLPAYPCLGLFQFNNDGLVGACEADLQSTITMLLMAFLVGRPGYISDPVIDTSKNQIIYAHCVAPSKVFGPNGPSNPYQIRSHSEDRKGAAVRSLMPLGEMTTTLKFHPIRREVVIHQARTVANIDEDKACRTKLAAQVNDIRKLMSEWDRFGWHRVTYYGDFRQQVETISALLGLRMVDEG
jgi:hypothetical protein